MNACREANAIDTDDVNDDVVFAFHDDMGPSSHSAGIVGGFMASTSPASGR